MIYKKLQSFVLFILLPGTVAFYKILNSDTKLDATFCFG